MFEQGQLTILYNPTEFEQYAYCQHIVVDSTLHLQYILISGQAGCKSFTVAQLLESENQIERIARAQISITCIYIDLFVLFTLALRTKEATVFFTKPLFTAMAIKQGFFKFLHYALDFPVVTGGE